MTEKEAVLLFKEDCFDEVTWARVSKRYRDRNCKTLVDYIMKNYSKCGANAKEIEKALRAEFAAV